jgi:hypothetical protein
MKHYTCEGSEARITQALESIGQRIILKSLCEIAATVVAYI